MWYLIKVLMEHISGGLAQLGERLPCKQEVTSSTLVFSTSTVNTVVTIKYSSLAQSVEHSAVNRSVVGSSPTGGAGNPHVTYVM